MSTSKARVSRRCSRPVQKAGLVATSSAGALVTRSCPTFTTPWTVPRQALLSVGFSRQEHWSGWPFASPDQDRVCKS